MSIEIKISFETTAEAAAFLAACETPRAQLQEAKTPRSIAKPEPAKPEPAKPEPAKPEPAKPEPAKPEPAKPEAAKAEHGIDYDTDIKPRVLNVAKRPGVGIEIIKHLFARMGVTNAAQIKEDAYPRFLKLLDLADEAADVDSVQRAIAELDA